MTADLIKKMLAFNRAADELRQWYLNQGIDPEAADYLMVNSAAVYVSRSHQWFYKAENELCVPGNILP